MIRCVLFDLDGTLIDTLDLYVRAMERTLEEISHKEVPADRLASLRLNSEPRLLGYFVPQDEVGGAHRRFLANYHALHETCFGGVYPGVQDLLKTLRSRRIKMGLVTGKAGAPGRSRSGISPWSPSTPWSSMTTYPNPNRIGRES